MFTTKKMPSSILLSLHPATAYPSFLQSHPVSGSFNQFAVPPAPTLLTAPLIQPSTIGGLGKNIYVRPLDNLTLILRALNLLYEVYVEQQQWNFSPNNPSELQVILRYGKKILLDRFTDHSIWFGAFDRDKLIGVTRLCATDPNGKFEVEGYPSSYPIQLFLSDKKQNCFEISRMAIQKEYSGQGVAKKLFLSLFEYSTTRASSIFTCTASSHLINFYGHIGWPLIKANAFKYEVQDPAPVNFYFASYNPIPENCEVERMIRNLSSTVYASRLLTSKL